MPREKPGTPLPDRPIPFLLRYVRRRPWMCGGLLALVVGAAACAVGVQYSMKLLVDAMAGVTRNEMPVWVALAVFIGLIGLENVFWRTSGWLGCRTIITNGVDIRLDLFEHLSGHAPRFFSEQLTGALGSRITAVAGASGSIIATLAWKIAPPVTDFLGALVIFVLVDWRMAVALMLFVAIVGGGLTLYGTRGRPLHRAYAEQAAHVGGELVDTVSNVTLVKAFSARKRELERLAHKFGSEAAAQRRSWMFLEKTRVLHDLCLWLMAGSMLAWAILLWSRGEITPGDVVVVSALTFRILHGSRDLALAFIEMTRDFGIVAETLRVVGQPHGVPDRPDARPLMPRGGAVTFEDVSFGYSEGRPVFQDLSLRIPAGQRVGIVGPSGAGKSTLVGLVQRLYDVDVGKLTIDGQDVSQVTQDSLRAAVAVVPQEISLFHRSVLENIRYGRRDATDAQVIAAAKAANCHDFITVLPQGYETIVGERGIKLSGGQRQRLAIARAILKDAPIIILDEATSALDTEAEREVQQALNELVRGRTVLAVAHRLSTVVSLDRIVVLVNGEVVEDGPPAELRRRRGVFNTMWRLQAEGFDIDAVA